MGDFPFEESSQDLMQTLYAFNMEPYMKKHVVFELEFRFGNGRSRNEMVYEAF